MDEVHGKEIDLQKTTIKIPGANKPRIGKSCLNLDANKLQPDINSLNLNSVVNLANVNSGNGHLVASDLKNPFHEDLNGNQPGLIADKRLVVLFGPF